MYPDIEQCCHSRYTEIGQHLPGVSPAAPFCRAQLLFTPITETGPRPGNHENRA